jgi:hypothetical protein
MYMCISISIDIRKRSCMYVCMYVFIQHREVRKKMSPFVALAKKVGTCACVSVSVSICEKDHICMYMCLFSTKKMQPFEMALAKKVGTCVCVPVSVSKKDHMYVFIQHREVFALVNAITSMRKRPYVCFYSAP